MKTNSKSEDKYMLVVAVSYAKCFPEISKYYAFRKCWQDY